ncbi:MAG: T9SS type A sorting domain-containing protein [Salinivirgaceae bacterium]
MYSGIGLDAPGEFEVAIAYTPDQLKPYQGMQVTKVAFTPTETNTIYIIKIWTGNLADSIIYQDTLSDMTIGQWNIVPVDSLVILEPDRLYFFGYHVNAQGGFPVGCDAGPTVLPGQSDLIRTETGPFYSLYDLGLDVNPNIEVFLEPTSSVKQIANITKDQVHFSNSGLTRIQKQAIKEPLKFENTTKAETPNSFIVYRNNESIGTSTEPAYHDILNVGGIYNYAVSALYDADESIKSESVEVLYDNNRIPLNTVISEAFINVGTFIGENGNEIANSPSSPGVYMGIFELNFELEKIASINYHSGSAILGYDPFATESSEARFMKYMMQTLSFPMAAFNGDLFQGGGSAESMYEAYRPIYDSALARLTPIALECTIEKVSGSKYRLQANSTLVGIYLPKNLVLHTVLTRDSIYHEWNSGKIKQVNYVATGMFPNANGATIDFDASGNAFTNVDVTIDPFLDISNYRVVSFIQDTVTFQILNGQLMKLPQKKAVFFTVLDGINPIEGASISVSGSILITDNQGKAGINLWDNQGEVLYSIAKEGYITQEGIFNMDTTTQVQVNLLVSGINSNQKLAAQVYPNPANNQLFVVSNEVISASVFDVSGKEILNRVEVSNALPIDISSLEKGIYFLKIMQNGLEKSYKFIKE